MLIGSAAPKWAEDLLYKWIELKDDFYGLTHNVFVFYTDLLPDNEGNKIRIFAEQEHSARDSLLNKRGIGMFSTYVKEDGFKIIDIPDGLEQWTIDFIKED